jgi:hypothetical protein
MRFVLVPLDGGKELYVNLDHIVFVRSGKEEDHCELVLSTGGIIVADMYPDDMVEEIRGIRLG